MGLAITSASCKRTLETVPVETLTKDFVFDVKDSAGVNASNFLTNLYYYMPNGFNRISGDFLDAASDDAISSSVSKSDVELMVTGGLTPFFNPDDAFTYSSAINAPAFSNYYVPIRKATEFITSIDRVPMNARLNDGTNRLVRNAWKAEARFLRAISYFELVKRYGGMPLLGDKVFELGDEVEFPRNSFDECIKYIVTECDTAIMHLRKDPVVNADYGRVTQGAAMALKARVLLYAASTLFNGGNIDPANPLTGYTNFDKERWKLAADASKAIIDLKVFSLEPMLNKLFLDRNNEIILAHIGQSSKSLEIANGPVGVGKGVGQGRTSPTQELVEAFPMINGLPITDPASNYDEANPYGPGIDSSQRRDPRLDMTVLHNGSRWLKASLETFNGGLSKPGGSGQQTKTGHYLRKFLGNFEESTEYATNQVHAFVIFRYGEVLLNYAEALNEYEGPVREVYLALIELRKRAGILPGKGAYGIKTDMTQDEMRKFIYNERRIEMAFEEHRYWDIRRWKIAEEVYNKPLQGYIIRRDPYTGAFSYSIEPVLTTTFSVPKMYLYPIPYNELVRNRNMKQNPGW
ncbi:RagB/SusD family nutrient uptake outer membrane protein [Mucilaginibacter hurinus]|uniref:RagB/SusD family nutrient uptake outer membrane protein n=2 Tax=Mucilaginibacter hurinus TaxID=2201324 RepID=A0A367GRR4_9SPHI|nr:RagB/SusD family nutrient uptake outer membrane protein [Mucilaginibacter hurinus]